MPLWKYSLLCKKDKIIRLFLGRRLMSTTPATENGSKTKKNMFLPGATLATVAMLGLLQARRLYEEHKEAEAIRRGEEPQFSPDMKSRFLQILPLRFISRSWGTLMSIEIPVWARSSVYQAWARAFHSDLSESALPLEEYASLRDFFGRSLKEGVRACSVSPTCLISPVDGIILKYGEVSHAEALIEQVKGFSYSLSSLLGTKAPPVLVDPNTELQHKDTAKVKNTGWKFWQRNITNTKIQRPMRQLFYCVLYLGPGDYHRVHSPADWRIFLRYHFPGNLFPVNARAVKTIKNLYLLNERVVLTGEWSQGFMAMALVGATNVGSIQLKFEPDLKTNSSVSKVPHQVIYGDSTPVFVEKGDEVAVFNMGSTVVMVFQAPVPHSKEDFYGPKFEFTVKPGERIKMGQELGTW